MKDGLKNGRNKLFSMPAITISRVSTEDQKIQGNSLPAQEKRMLDYCQRKGFEVVKKFSFDESAYKTNRDEFDAIIEYIKNYKGFLIVCFDKIDRLSRNVFDKRVSWLYEIAINDKLELHFVSDNQIINSKISAVEKFTFSMSLGLAKYYSDAISDNVKRVNENARNQGITNTALPVGYIGRGKIVSLSDDSWLVSEAFSMFSTGNYSQAQITAYLNKHDFKTRKGLKITKQTFHVMLNNPFYYGLAKSKYGNYSHSYPPLTTEHIFEKCQNVLNQNSKNSKKLKKKAKEYSFRNLLTCAGCGRTINPDGPKKGKYIYYRCVNPVCGFYQKAVKEEVLLEKAESMLAKLKFSDEAVKFVIEKLKADFNKDSLYQKQKRVALYNEKEGLEQKRSVFLDLLADRSITRDEYAEKRKELETKIYELDLELTKETRESTELHLTVEMMFSLINRLPEIFKSSNTAQKNQILKYLISNSTQTGSKVDLNLKKPFMFLYQNQESQAWRRI
jgi:site-specific DNA recombinase